MSASSEKVCEEEFKIISEDLKVKADYVDQ